LTGRDCEEPFIRVWTPTKMRPKEFKEKKGKKSAIISKRKKLKKRYKADAAKGKSGVGGTLP